MRIDRVGFGLLAGLAVLGLSAAPASAEFFGCHDKRGQLLYRYSGSTGDFRDRNYSRYSSSRVSSDYSAHTRYYRAGSSHASYSDSGRYRSDRSWR